MHALAAALSCIKHHLFNFSDLSFQSARKEIQTATAFPS